MDFPASSYYQPTANYESDQPPFASYDSQKNQVLTVTSYNPQGGPQGSHLYVYIDSVYDLSVPTITLSLMFATRQCSSQLTSLGARGNTYQYLLTAEAPTLASTGWHSPRVPLRVRLQDTSGLIENDPIDTGIFFHYADGGNHQDQSSPDDLSRKRKMHIDSSEVIRVPAKRASNQQLHSGVVESYPSLPYTQSDSLAYLKTSQPDPLNPGQGRSATYGRSQNQRQFRQSDASRRSSQSFSVTPTSAQSLMKAPSPQMPSWGSPYASTNHPGRSPGLVAASASRISSMSSPPSSANPPLIRTSTLQSSGSSSSSGGGSFNPYAIYPHSRATLKINGDLDSMVEHWTPDEWSAKRRLVQFWRNQSGSEIHTNFEPVTPDDRPTSSICISCILWEERRECFVTSVDTIFLLESLVGVHFTVEEKNRIRRNLEGFRPMTVSKAKTDSENFFKVIMGFPIPKPRNIEKDVKVFPWKILAHALKKIIGKYSASYSSTASALLTPQNRSHAYGGQSEASTEPSITSPQSSSSSTISSAYTTTLASTISPNPSHGRLPTPAHFSDVPTLQAPAPRLSHTYALSSSSPYAYASHEQMSSSLGPLPMTSQPGRGSLDFSSYIETSPTLVNPHPIQHYRRESLNTASSQAPASSSEHDVR